MSTADPQVDELRAATGADVSGPDDPGYAEVTAWNPVRTVHPLAIVHAQSPPEIAAAVDWARANDRRIVVQRTGHGIHPTGEPTVLIDTRRMTTLEIDPATQIARIGSGNTGRDVLDAAAPHGLLPVIGSAPGVSIAGVLTGGGVGPLAHTLGACSDYVRGMTVVTGDGEIRHATATENPDLFWGLRGGKATLGIVTEFELELVAQPTLWGGCAYLAADALPEVVRRWVDWSARLPREGTTSFAILQLPPLPVVPEPIGGRMVLAVRFAWLGDPADGERLAGELLAGTELVLGGYGPLGPADLGQIHQDPVDPLPWEEDGFLLTGFDADAAEALIASAGPSSGSLLTLVEVRALGLPEASADLADDAFIGRTAAYNLMTGVVPDPDHAAAAAAARPVLDAMAPWSTGRAMPNFVIGADRERIELVWEPATLDRLSELGDRYDPAGVFRIGQVARRAEPALA